MPVVRPRVVMRPAASAANHGPAAAGSSGASAANTSAGALAGTGATVSGAPYAAATALAAPASFGGAWTSLGPQPETATPWGDVAGRVTALALDPANTTGNTLYVGAAYGGLWKSTNAMSAQPTFTPIGDNMPTLAVGSIAIDDSTSPPTIYVGTGEPNNSLDSYYGVGILKSADGGQTWTEVTEADSGAETFLGLAFGAIVIAPSQPQTLLACASNAKDTQDGGTEVPGVYQSTDGGQTWSLVLSQPDNVPGYATADSACTSLVYDATRGEYIAALRGRGYYASSTGAASSWTALASPFPSGTAATVENFYRASLAVRGADWFGIIADYKDNPSAPGSTDTGLAVSVNGGQSWQPIAVPPSVFCAAQGSVPCQGAYDQYVAAPPGGTSLVVGGIDVWSAPAANGTSTTWTNLTNSYSTGSVHPDQHAIAFVDGTHWFIGNDGGVWSTANAGAAWTDMNATLNTIQFMSVSAIGGGVYFGGSQDNGTALSAASGTAWKLIWGGDGGDTAVSPANTQELLTENSDVSLQESQDGGSTFNPVVTSSTITDASSFYVPYELDPSDPTQVLLGTDRVWEGPADPTAPGTGWAPLGTQSVNTSLCTQTTDTVTAIAGAPSSADVIYEGFADGTLMMTANATAAQPGWAPINVPVAHACNPPTPVGTLAVSPADPNTVYVGLQGLGTGAHVYKSTDGGSTFTDITGNLPDVPINSIVIDPNTPTNVYVADDVGVFASSDGGQANEVWSRLGTGLPAAAVLQIALTGGSTPSIVAATHGRGAWVIPAQAPPNFTVSLSPASQTVNGGAPGGTATLQLTTAAVNGYPTSGTLTLTCTVSYGSCGVTPASVTVGATTTLTLDTSQMQAGTTETVTVQATDGVLTHSATAQFTVQGFSLLVTDPQGTTLRYLEAAGPAATKDVGLDSLGGIDFSDPITVSCPNAPAGITCTPNAASYDLSQSGYVNATLSVVASASTAPGAYTINVSATGGGLTQSTTFTVTVVDFTLALNPTLAHALRGVNSVTTTATVSTASGFTGAVTLSCSGGGLACAASPASISPGQSATIIVSGLNALSSAMQSLVTVTATSGSQQVTQPLTVEVDDFAISYPPNNGASVAVLPGVQTVAFPGTTIYNEGQFSGPVALSCAAAPAPVTCSLSPSSVSNGQPATTTFTGLSGLASGVSVSSTITGSAQGITHQSPGASLVISPVGLGTAKPQENFAPAAGDSNYTLSAPITLANSLNPQISLYETTLQATCSVPSPAQCKAAAYSSGGVNATLDLTNYSGPDQITLQLALNATQSGVTVSDKESVPLALADYALSASPATATVQPGGAAAYTLTAKMANGWNGNTTFSCSGLPVGASCVFSQPGSSQPVGLWDLQGASVPITLTIKTSSTSSAPPPPSGPGRWLWLWALALLAALAALAGVQRRRRPAWRWAGAATAAVFALALFMAACGGGGSVQTGNTKSALPPATTYPVTVTANSNFAAANASLTRTVQVSLTVQ